MRPGAKHLLALFSGPSTRLPNLSSALAPAGWTVENWDTTNVAILDQPLGMHDLSSDSNWSWFFHDVNNGRLMALWVQTPSGTFQPPFRSPTAIYGVKTPHISYRKAEQTQQETYFALQTAKLLSMAHSQGVPWGFVNPDPCGNPVSAFNLPEFVAVAALPGVTAHDFDMCCLGAPTTRSTRVLAFGLDLSQCHNRCQHPPTMWDYRDKFGNMKRVRGSHMPPPGVDLDKLYGYPSAFLDIVAESLSGSQPPIAEERPRRP